MELKSKLQLLAANLDNIKEDINTEQSTKMALVAPFIQALGYNIFDPREVDPEFTADIGIKKGEKVDYCLRINGKPQILIECKHHIDDLKLHNTQLFRYFTATEAKFVILTNGILYKFYTDLDKNNKLDKKPFFEFDISNFSDSYIEELSKFRRESFDEKKIFNRATNLKYLNQLKALISEELQNPSEELVKCFTYKVFDGRVTSNVLSTFTKLVNKTIKECINEIVDKRWEAAKLREVERREDSKETNIIEEEEFKIITTEKELIGFRIVQAIVSKILDPQRVSYKDTQNYINIIIDGSVRKRICRLYLNGPIYYLRIYNESSKHQLKTLNDIYTYSEKLLETTKKHI